jgi:hypothetical protein
MLTYADVCRKKRRWRCVRAADYFDGISCPAGMFKKSKKEVQADILKSLISCVILVCLFPIQLEARCISDFEEFCEGRL